MSATIKSGSNKFFTRSLQRMKLIQKIAVGFLRKKLQLLSLVSKKRAAETAFDVFCTPMRKSNKKRPPIFANGEQLHLTVEGIKITGHRWNAPQQKKCLIVHGFESTSYNFDRYIQPLVDKGYEVLAFDAPAHGDSAGQQITLPLYVSTIRNINEQFGVINSYLAHSFGGLAVCHFLETVPNQSLKVVLIAPATETTTAIDSFFQFLHLGNGFRQEFDQLIYERGGRRPHEYSIRRAMNHIASSVLWIHDKNDEMTPLSDALKIKEDNHPNVEFMVTEGLGHRRIYRDIQVVKRIVDFL
jgi:pimeloyl-ACP methyl ester carboxylesterase